MTRHPNCSQIRHSPRIFLILFHHSCKMHHLYALSLPIHVFYFPLIHTTTSTLVSLTSPLFTHSPLVFANHIHTTTSTQPHPHNHIHTFFTFSQPHSHHLIHTTTSTQPLSQNHTHTTHSHNRIHTTLVISKLAGEKINGGREIVVNCSL